MRLYKLAAHLFALSLLIFAVAACSGGSTPVSMDEKVSDVPASFGTPIDGGNVLAVYEAVIDPEAGTFTITPETRSGAYHLPLTSYYPGVLQITGFGFVPNFWADIKLIHPLPGSGIRGYDPRVIAIVPANPGVSFNYPAFGIVGNNKLVMRHDGWTGLYDPIGGPIPGNVNPFMCYFKGNPFREWPDTGTTAETIRWEMNLAGFGGPIVYRLVVDVSTNFPAPPTPVVDNTKDPLILDVNVGPGLVPTGGNANVIVLLLDWQGPLGNVCMIESPPLFPGLVNLTYDTPGPNPNTYFFTGVIGNPNNAPVGDYPVMVGAWDADLKLINYREGVASVTPDVDNHVHSKEFLPKPPEDEWFDICVQMQGPVYVCANHPDTQNVDLTRTAIKFNNDLSGMLVLNPGTGMNDPENYGMPTFWNRIDVTLNGFLVTNPGFTAFCTWEVAGNAAILTYPVNAISCGGGWTGNLGFFDVWDQDDYATYGSCGMGWTETTDCGTPEYGGTIKRPDLGVAGEFGGLAAPTLYVWNTLVAAEGIDGTEDSIFFISSSSEGRLSISGSWMDGSFDTQTEKNSVGSYGTGDKEFMGGLDVARNFDNFILTLEKHGANQYRFQKFDLNFNWIWSSPWIYQDHPLRMDFDKASNRLYLLCDEGIHICEVD